MHKPAKTTVTISVDKLIVDLLREYQNDILEKSRSIAVQDILLDFFLENGYVDPKTYAFYRSTMFFVQEHLTEVD